MNVNSDYSFKAIVESMANVNGVGTWTVDFSSFKNSKIPKKW